MTWHLGYPHRGGYRLEVLDADDTVVLRAIVPGKDEGEFMGEDDATTTSFAVRFPRKFECKNCTLRLTRQALEWGPRYMFWSCADIDVIVPTPGHK